jgi:pyruvate dehydrogenase E1 component beta subunit
MVLVALEVAAVLESEGISIEVVDPRTTVPLDIATLVRSAEKTGRVLVVDEGYAQYGVASHIAAVISEEAFYSLDSPVRRLAARDVPIPFSPVLEDQTVPTVDVVAEAARRTVRGEEF